MPPGTREPRECADPLPLCGIQLLAVPTLVVNCCTQAQQKLCRGNLACFFERNSFVYAYDFFRNMKFCKAKRVIY